LPEQGNITGWLCCWVERHVSDATIHAAPAFFLSDDAPQGRFLAGADVIS